MGRIASAATGLDGFDFPTNLESTVLLSIGLFGLKVHSSWGEFGKFFEGAQVYSR